MLSSTISLEKWNIKKFLSTWTAEDIVFGNIQEMSKRTVKRAQTPDIYCEPFIENGFRPEGQPWSFYLKSLFFRHNELVNVWTHLLGAIAIVVTTYTHYGRKFDLINDPYAWPLAAGLITAFLTFFCSAFAHLLHNRSTLVHHTCFLFDFMGIGIHIFGSGFMHYYYSSLPGDHLPMRWFLPIVALAAFIAFVCNCVAQTVYHRPYPPQKRILQLAPCALAYIISMYPIWRRLATTEWTLTCRSHIMQTLSLVMAAIFFGGEIPQRWRPGHLDLVGQGHQIFHTFIALVVCYQFDGVSSDFATYQHILRERLPPPSLAVAFGPVALLLVAMTSTVYYFQNRMKCHHD